MISDEKVGAKGVKVRCKKCGHVILVRRPQDVATAAPSVPPPPPPDDAGDATQVMQNPLQSRAALGAAEPDSTSPGGGNAGGSGGPNGLLAGIADDEIGAVFDQVLSGKTDAGQDGQRDPHALGEDSDDRMSTRVLDAETVKKLTEEAAHGDDHSAGLNGSSRNGHDKGPPADHDWFVAIDEKQVGPLKLDKMKERWDQGEIGPDSLCWRAGFSDWMPLSDIDELASVLAPQPRKPVIVASTSMDPGVGAMMSVESAFSSGGISRTVRSEVPVMAGGAAAQENGGWKPSAASALASLVKEEIEALARPPTEAAPPPPEAPPAAAEEKHSVRGILDLPSQEHRIPKDVAVGPQVASISQVRMPSPAPAHAQPGFAPAPYGAAPYATQYAPPRTNKGLIIVGGGVIALMVLMLGVVAFLLMDRNGSGGTQIAQPAEPVAQPVAVARAEASAKTEAAPEKEPAKAEKADKAETQPAKGEPEKKSAPAVAREPAEDKESEPAKRVARAVTPKQEREPPPEPRSSPAPAPDPESSGDDFDEVFGGGSKPKKEAPPKQTRRETYIPPAPGSASIPDRLGQSDIMQVVLSNKAAIVKCVEQQKQKDPGVNGKLVMRWTVRTNGRTSNVSCQTSEFKSTVMASCIGGLIKGWKFPAHQVQGDPIDFPFTF